MKLKSTAILIFLLLTISSCSTQIHFENYIDANAPLILTIHKINSKTGVTENEKKVVEPNSEKFIHFKNWCDENSTNWKNASDSYSPKFVVTQKNFQLLCLENSVVFNFTVRGKFKQYWKSIEKGELNFLIN